MDNAELKPKYRDVVLALIAENFGVSVESLQPTLKLRDLAGRDVFARGRLGYLLEENVRMHDVTDREDAWLVSDARTVQDVLEYVATKKAQKGP